ncbi:MAG: hypothetical protein H0V51_17155, partial [Chloroflexi bacterium]|nr:hypothetical protein [Chloroflexota bacterium]
ATPTPTPTPGGAAPAGPPATPTPTPVPIPAQNYSIEFFVEVDGLLTDVTSWTYGGPNANDWTRPPARPSKSCE